MKLSAVLLGLLCAGSPAVQAFPHLARGFSLDERGQSPALDAALSAAVADAARQIKEKRTLFNPLTTPVEVTGKHAFIPPNYAAGDQRGPCPGLNALANHGYIGRNGVATLAEALVACNQVFGMGLDLTALLAVLSTVFVGNPISLTPGFSIGSMTSASENLLGNLGGLLGKPRGLVGSHNMIEGDASPTRADLYVTGDSSTLDMAAFRELFERSSGEGDYNMDVLSAHANDRFSESVATNPDFYYGPLTGLLFRNAGFMLPSRMLSNHSLSHPLGLLNKQTLMSMYGVHMVNNELVYHAGCERIPENWYRRPIDYTILELTADTVVLALRYPQVASFGGNVGSVNSFVGVDLGDLTGGVLNAVKLLEGDNLLCLIFEVIKQVAPNSLSSLFATIDAPLQLILKTLKATPITCPAFEDLAIGGTSLFDALGKIYPGAKSSVL